MGSSYKRKNSSRNGKNLGKGPRDRGEKETTAREGGELATESSVEKECKQPRERPEDDCLVKGKQKQKWREDWGLAAD